MNQSSQLKLLIINFAITVNNKRIYLQLIGRIKFNYDKYPQGNYFARILLEMKVTSKLK